MLSRIWRVVCRYAFVAIVLGAVVLTSAPVAAQTAANIVGRVTDESGAVLAGVSVIATSPALQVPQLLEVTNEVGEYRLSPLPAGLYEVTFELSGFGSLKRPEIRLTVGFTARIDVTLQVATVSEAVTVTGAAALVDVTPATASTVLTKDELDLLPTARNGLITMMSMAPGVRSFIEVGGNQMGENPSARVFGQGGEPWYTLEGVATATLGGGGSGNFWDYQVVEEARVETVGSGAEAATRGVQLNAVVKSGGNDPHGSYNVNYSSDNFQSNNIDEELQSLGIESADKLVARYDHGGDLGGRIIRDKVWFYGAARWQGTEANTVGQPRPDGSPATYELDQRFLTGKGSYQLNNGNRFVAFYQELVKTEVSPETEFTAWEARGNPHNLARFSKGEWQGIRSNNLVAQALFGYREYTSEDPFNTDGLVGGADIATEQVFGEAITAGERYYERRYHTQASLTWYKPNSFHGNHEVKAGFDWIPDTSTRWEQSRPVNYHLLFDDGAPFQLVVLSSPTVPPVKLNYTSFYVRDHWNMGRRFTLNAGLRFVRNNGFVPEVCREAADPPGHLVNPAGCFDKVQLPIYNSLQPRIHASYDVSGDGRTVLKGGWGRFRHIHLIGDLTRVSKNSIRYGLYTWSDQNGNRNYDVGEVNLDPRGSDFVQTTGRVGSPYEAGVFSAEAPNSVVNPDQKEPFSDEFSVSLERELMRNVGIRVTGVYSKYQNIYRQNNNKRPFETYNIPITNRDPGPDGLLNTGDDGGNVTYFEYSTALQGIQNEELAFVTDPSQDQSYKSFEIAGIKRLSDRWQLMASYSQARRDRPTINSTSVSGFGASVQAAALNPNAEIFTEDKTTDHTTKISGSYLFPYDLLVSMNFESRSGDPFARQVQFRGGRTIPSIVLNVEPIGAQRLPTVNLTNVRLEKSFRLNATHKLSVKSVLYNMFNVNTATAVQRRSGATYLRPQEIVPPRVIEFGVSYSF